MFSHRLFVAIILSMVALVQSLPTSHGSVSSGTFQRPSSIEPETLLGRHYSHQARSAPIVPSVAQDAEGPSPDALLPHHHSPQKRHSLPFPKYLAERTASSHLRARGMAEENYVSYVGAKPAEGSYGVPYPSPSPESEAPTYSSSVTPGANPTASADAKASPTKASLAKAKHTKNTTSMKKMV